MPGKEGQGGEWLRGEPWTSFSRPPCQHRTMGPLRWLSLCLPSLSGCGLAQSGPQPSPVPLARLLPRSTETRFRSCPCSGLQQPWRTLPWACFSLRLGALGGRARLPSRSRWRLWVPLWSHQHSQPLNSLSRELSQASLCPSGFPAPAKGVWNLLRHRNPGGRAPGATPARHPQPSTGSSPRLPACSHELEERFGC